jgi:hypothetical protein
MHSHSVADLFHTQPVAVVELDYTALPLGQCRHGCIQPFKTLLARAETFRVGLAGIGQPRSPAIHQPFQIAQVSAGNNSFHSDGLAHRGR